MGSVLPTDEEFHTILYKAAGYINNYPLSYSQRSSSELDLLPLTPAHFIRGKTMQDIAPSSLSPSSFTQSYTRVNNTLDKFWKRLILELSSHLRAYPKWSTIKRNIQVGDIGVLLDESKRNFFPLVIVRHCLLYTSPSPRDRG